MPPGRGRGGPKPLELVQQGPAPRHQAARRRLREARSAVEQAELNLGKTRLAAPAEGLSDPELRGGRDGPPATRLNSGGPKKPWVEVFVPEPRSGRCIWGCLTSR